MSQDENIEEVHIEHEKFLWVKMLLGMALGIILGLLFSPHGGALLPEGFSSILASWIKIPGVLFLGLIQMVVIPLILCSIVLGIMQSGELSFLKKVGLRAVLYFVVTTLISISIGMVVVHAINPGQYIDQQMIEEFSFDGDAGANGAKDIKTFDNLTVPQRIENLIPKNVPSDIVEKNLLQIVIAAMVFGVALLTLPKASAKPVLDICVSGQALAMTVIGWAMKIAPYAVFGLLFDITVKLGFSALAGMGMYMATVFLGLLSMVGVYLIFVSVIGRMNPLTFLKSIRETQLLAFSTSSSAATMPFTLACAEEELNVSPKISRFMVPLGATINMDGTAMYQAIAAVFLVQVFGALSGVELTTTELILLMVTTVGASIGTPATPGVGIVVLATILTGIGLPPAAVGFILGVDRILDMCRTTVNVTGDLTACVVMDKWIK